MSTVMSVEARQQFLADVHVGVLSVATADVGATLATPVWYRYDPEFGVSVIIDRGSAKAKAIDAAGRYSMVAQTEVVPYSYVGVEGPVIDSHPCTPDELRAMASRYLGELAGAVYAEHLWLPENQTYVMRPERWSSADLTAPFEGLFALVDAAPSPVE